MATVGVDSYVLRMLDEMTAPLRKIEAQMEKVGASMEKLQKLTMATFAGGAVLAGISIAGKAISGFLSILETGIGIAYRFGEAIVKATMFRQRNIPALDVLLGKGKGEGIFQNALRIGGNTAASEIDVVNQVKALAGAGYSGGSLNRVNAGLLDVQALGGNEAMSSLAYYFQKFKGGLSVERDDLRMAAATAGIKEKDILSSMIGLGGGSTAGLNDAQLSKKVESMKKAGQLSGEVAAEALLDAIRKKLDNGGKLGDFALKMGKGSMAGLLSNLEDAPMRFLAQMKLEEMPGVKSLMEFVKRILVFFDNTTTQGKQLARVVEDITNSLFGGFDKITDKDLARWFQGAVNVAKQLVEVIKSIWKWIDQLSHGDLSDWVKASKDVFKEVGALIAEGIWESIKILPGFSGTSPGKLVTEAAQHEQMGEGAYARALRHQASKGVGGAGELVEGKFLSPLRLGKSEVKIENLTVNGALSPEAARTSVGNLTEALRDHNLRAGQQPAPAGQ